MYWTWVFEVGLLGMLLLTVIFLKKENLSHLCGRNKFISKIGSAEGMRLAFGGLLVGLLCTYMIIFVLMIIIKGEVVAPIALKGFIVLLAVAVNYVFKREYRARYGSSATTNKFLIVSFILVFSMMATSTNNLFLLNLFIDGTSMLLAALIATSVTQHGYEYQHASLTAYNYLLLSAITSFMSYLGSLLIFMSAQTFNIQLAGELVSGSNNHLLFSAGVVLWCVKLLFLLGIFPFYYYVFKVAGVLSLPANFLFFTSTKIPGLFTAFMLAELIGRAGILWLQPTLLSLAAISVFISSTVFYESIVIKHLLAASSVNAMSFIFISILFSGGYPIAVANLYFISYCAALSIFMIFLIAVLERCTPDSGEFGSEAEVKTIFELDVSRIFRGERSRASSLDVSSADSLNSGDKEGNEPTSLRSANTGKTDFTRAHYVKIIISSFAYALLSLGGVPLTPGFAFKLQVIGLVVGGGFKWISLFLAVVSAISTVWYVIIAFKVVSCLWEAATEAANQDDCADGITEAANQDDCADEITEEEILNTKEIERIALCFVALCAFLIVLSLLGMQGWFIQIVADRIILFW